MATTIEDAIRTAIEYETKVAAVYRKASAAVSDETGRRVFAGLAAEEDGHVAYLEDRFRDWTDKGTLSVTELKTAVPSQEKIAASVASLAGHAGRKDQGEELQLLYRARDVEIETSAFYQKMTDELPGDGRKLFARFVEIEAGHLAIVEAEIDHVDKMGFWLGFEEFDLAGEPGQDSG